MRLPVSVTRNFARSVLKFKKESPHIFFVAGVIGVVTSTVMACRSTLKVSETLDDIQKDIVEAKSMKGNVIGGPAKLDLVYTESDFTKDLIYVYAKGGFKIARLYGPSVIIGVASIASLTGSHIQLARRNAALMAAYAAVQKAFDDYRQRVREQYGEENELDIYRGIVSYNELKNEEGEKELVAVSKTGKGSPYARIFDEYSPNWKKDPELNMMFVRCQQNWANQLLQSRGHVFLNEIYDMLGVDRSTPGSVVGWVLGDNGDNFIDFGIYEAYNFEFVRGNERSVWLDFNVDGVIYDKI